MKAGHELDMLVAEYFMGWKRGCLYGNGDGEWIIDGKVSLTTWDQTPRWSTEIGASWLLVEELRHRGRVVIVKCDGLRTGDFNPAYTVLVDHVTRTDADTAPFAICLAVMKVVDCEVGNG